MSTATSTLPDPRTIYVSPTGKRCMFVPSLTQSASIYFRYLDNAEVNGGGFSLSWQNFALMRPDAVQRTRAL